MGRETSEGTNEEDDGRRGSSSFPEHLSNCSFGFSDVLVEKLLKRREEGTSQLEKGWKGGREREGDATHLRSLDRQKVDPTLRRQSLRRQRLTTSRRPIK